MKVVTFFSDKHMIPGLHVTLYSMLSSLSSLEGDKLKVYLFLDSVSVAEKSLLVETFANFKEKAELEIIDFSPVALSEEDLLIGNSTVYGRLYLADLLPDVERCLYLDSDLLINCCILELYQYFDGENILLADGYNVRSDCHDRELYERAGLDLKGKCFNSGVLGVDLKMWRQTNVSRICEDVVDEYKGLFKCADQGVLNVALHDSFSSIGKCYNFPLFYNDAAIDEYESCIYHFVGSPKPWDIFGRFTSNHYKMWREVYEKTAIGGRGCMRYSSFGRSLRLMKRVFLETVKSKFRRKKV